MSALLVQEETTRDVWQNLARLAVLDRDIFQEALGRVLAEDVAAEVDVPGFDRSNMDGFALRAEDTYGATEDAPLRLRLNEESIPTGVLPRQEVLPGTATSIATGGKKKEPRGAQSPKRWLWAPAFSYSWPLT